MKNMYLTNAARQAAIDEITRQIDVLGSMKSGDLSYIDYRSIVQNLAELRKLIRKEMERNSR